MCGIIGYVGKRQSIPILLNSLKRLDYRGYDSAGIAILERGIVKDNQPELQVYKTQGLISVLESKIPKKINNTYIGIGHTRWATCGKPSDINAHPHTDCNDEIAVVHNGIIENYIELKRNLEAKGHKFKSETDTEVFPHLIEEYLKSTDLNTAIWNALDELEGTYAFAIIHRGQPDKLYGVCYDCPLIIAVGNHENFLTSDTTATLEYTREVIYSADNELCILTPETINIFDKDGNKIQREVVHVPWSIEDAERSGFKHFMLKGIYEQPEVVRRALAGWMLMPEIEIGNYSGISIVACGTSYHAGLVGKYILEHWASIPVEVILASEYRYSDCATTETNLVVGITQSGETADTVTALKQAKARGQYTFAITNVVGSRVTRIVDVVIQNYAGPEICVAATKTFISQLISLYQLGLKFGYMRNRLDIEKLELELEYLRRLPKIVTSTLQRADMIRKCATDWIINAEHVFFIGRYINYPVALEGALKLKEISYIHAEGFPAGELKHGPLALITDETPVVAIVAQDHTYDKMLNNIAEVSARDAPVIAIAVETDSTITNYVDYVIPIPEPPQPIYTPIPVSVVLQLLAYYAADLRGCEIDKPRNLAKSVTVE